YFVWFRVDQNVVEFYKTTNNVFSLVKSVPQTIAAGTWYDYKVTYDRITGEIAVWINNAYVGSYTDPSPIANGNYVSFRNGNCDYAVDGFKVYRSRAATATINVGSAATNDIRYENVNPATYAANINSIVKDTAYNLSTIATQTLNVDWTAPLCSSLINDGTGADVDTVYSTTQLSGNWGAAKDTNSSVAYYQYAIGTSPGLQDIVPFTNNGLATSVTKTGLTLSVGQHYYFTVQAVDGAGLICAANSSDGAIVETTTGVQPAVGSQQLAVNIYPNPNNGNFYINSNSHNIEVEIMDITGRVLVKEKLPVVNGSAELKTDLPDGTYFIMLKDAGGRPQKLIISR
ncbi:MAG TPA: T9SS type A sorting domain-containing protein, partial [Bacteroidia bacterium]|nr:T9SS type A sorting domain-containing protein [Bacteroidia bacterium]